LSAEAWDASDLLGVLRHATARLRADVDEVNALNVFPVPDGDTGSNMLATMQAALEEAGLVAAGERSVSTVAEAFSRGALMGARGNSGVILSQLMRGMADALAGKPQVDGTILAGALESGWKASVEAVAHPVEGTMLTVSREAAMAAQAAAGNGARLEDVLAGAVRAASEAVIRTPEQLPVLAEAGVVDAGGRGVELLLRGALGFVRGEPLPTADHDAMAFPSFAVDEDAGYGYETVYLVVPNGDGRLDPQAMREHLATIGESVLVAGDERAVKIHVHNERPDLVIAYGLSLGGLSSIVVENLDRQAHRLRWRGRPERSSEPVARAAAAVVGPAVVAVAPGPGLAGIFADLGAAGVVTGGQGANPSTGDLVESIRATGSSTVIVLPNNPNVRLAARQAGELLPDVEVSVVPTRNAAEGVAAMLTINAADSLEENVRRMTKAGHALQTLQVTAAVRDARIERRRVKRGEFIVLGADEGLLAAHVERDEAVIAALARLEPGFELVTLYHGEGVTADEAEALAARISERYADVEVEIVDGGQPHYSFLLAAE
jgi:DAK2 domain fusion protein YloV